MSDERRGPLRPTGPPLGGDREVQYGDRTPWWRRHLQVLLAVVVLLVVVGGITGAVLATRNVGDVSASDGGAGSASASVSASPSASLSSTVPAATTAPPAPAPVQSSADGTVITINGAQWGVAVQKGLQITVVITADTVFPRGKTAADVVVGTNVSVIGGLLSGVLTASKVTIDR